METKVLNPHTNKLITIGGKTYNDLIKEGYTRADLIDYTNNPKPIFVKPKENHESLKAKFFNNPTVDPRKPNKRIYKNKTPFKNLVTEFGDPYKINTDDISDIKYQDNTYDTLNKIVKEESGSSTPKPQTIKIKSPKTKRMIDINGNTYKQLLKDGYFKPDIINTKHESRKLTQLSGVNTFVYFKLPQDRTLLILGENHNINNICENDIYPVHKWLYDICLNSPTCLDLFVEDSFVFENHEKYDIELLLNLDLIKNPNPRLNMIRFIFREYTMNNKNLSTRYHLIDARKINEKIESPFVILPLMYNNIIKNNLKNMISDNSENYDKILEYYSGATDKYSNYYNAYLNNLIKNTDIILPNYIIYRQEYLKLVDKMIKKTSFGLDGKTHFFKVLLSCYKNDNATNLYHNLISILMDVYFLLRYLHSYDEEKVNRGPLHCRDKKFLTHEKSIIYSGNRHSIVYTLFFIRWFKIEPEIAIFQESDNQCIKLPQEFDLFDNM